MFHRSLYLKFIGVQTVRFLNMKDTATFTLCNVADECRCDNLCTVLVLVLVCLALDTRLLHTSVAYSYMGGFTAGEED